MSLLLLLLLLLWCPASTVGKSRHVCMISVAMLHAAHALTMHHVTTGMRLASISLRMRMHSRQNLQLAMASNAMRRCYSTLTTCNRCVLYGTSAVQQAMRAPEMPAVAAAVCVLQLGVISIITQCCSVHAGGRDPF